MLLLSSVRWLSAREQGREELQGGSIAWHKAKGWARPVARDQAGQSLLGMAAAFISLLVVVGLSVDLALIYVERIQSGRACDAASLAGAEELPFEEFAVKRAIHHLAENGYDPANTELIVKGPANAASPSWDALPGSRGTITVDTESYQDSGLEDPHDSADKIRV